MSDLDTKMDRVLETTAEIREMMRLIAPVQFAARTRPEHGSVVLSFRQTFGDSVRRLRLQAGMSQTLLAEILAAGGHPTFSQSAVWAVETGARGIHIEVAYALADALGSTVDEMAGRPGQAVTR